MRRPEPSSEYVRVEGDVVRLVGDPSNLRGRQAPKRGPSVPCTHIVELVVALLLIIWTLRSSVSVTGLE